MFKITDTMVLALLKKGMTYEIEEYEMEMEVPLSNFLEYEESNSVIKITGKVKGFKMEVTQD